MITTDNNKKNEKTQCEVNTNTQNERPDNEEIKNIKTAVFICFLAITVCASFVVFKGIGYSESPYVETLNELRSDLERKETEHSQLQGKRGTLISNLYELYEQNKTTEEEYEDAKIYLDFPDDIKKDIIDKVKNR